VGEAALAAGKKNAARLRAALVFLDEASFLMAPLVRRSWSPRGQTPLLRQRTRSHQKVGVVAALCVSPRRNRVRLFFRLYPSANITAVRLVAFLRELARAAKAPIVLVWDRLPAHRGKTVAAYAEADRRLRCVLLPPYAPELNPVEYVFSHLKMNPLANLPCTEVVALAGIARQHGRSLQRQEALLRSFIHHSPLSLRLR
jgi:transposase